MSSANRPDLARILSEGFFAVYVKGQLSDAERQDAIENLASVIRDVSAHGKKSGELDLAARLHQAIGVRSEIPAQELRTLASQLK